MISARNSEAGDYMGIDPLLDRALALLNNDFLSTVTGEVIRLDGDKLYVSANEYDTVPLEDTFFEAHRRYLDIHVLTEGVERVDISHPDRLELFDHRDDFYAYTGEAEQTVILRPGSFLAVFPGDAHRIKIQCGEKCRVKKVVFKVLAE